MLTRLFTVGLAAGLAAAPAAAQQNKALAAVPADAAIVVHLSGVEKAQGRLDKMLQNALPQIGGFAMGQLKNMLADSPLARFQGRDMSAVRKDAPAFLLVPSFDTLGEDEPELVVMVPVTDFAKFKATFLKEGERKEKDGLCRFKEYYLAGKGDYFVASATASLAKKFAKSGGASLAGKLKHGAAEAFLKSDVSACVDLAALNEFYGDQIAEAAGQIDGLAEAGMMDPKQAQMIKGFVKGFAKAIKDGERFVAGVDFRPDGMRLAFQAVMKPGSDSDKFLAKLSPKKLDGLSKMPAGQMMYSEFHIDEPLAETLMGYLNGLDPTAGKALKTLTDAGLSGQTSASTLPSPSLKVETYKDVKKAYAGMVEMLKGLKKGAAFQNAPLKSDPTVEEGAESYKGMKFTKVTMEFDIAGAMGAQGQQIPPEMQKMMTDMMKNFVNEKINVWIGQDGQKLYQVAADSWSAAEKLLAKYMAGDEVGASKAFKLTRRNLPAEAHMVSMLETGKFVKLVGNAIIGFANQTGALPVGQLPKMTTPPGKPTYIGFAGYLNKGTGRFEVFIPARGVTQIKDMVLPLTGRVD